MVCTNRKGIRSALPPTGLRSTESVLVDDLQNLTLQACWLHSLLAAEAQLPGVLLADITKRKDRSQWYCERRCTHS